jgi:hypothetical protein
MSETNRLGISITATSTATATIGQLNKTIAELQSLLGNVGGSARDASGKITAGIQANISAIQAEIAARGAQAASIKTVTAAIVAQGEAAAVVYRTLQQNIDLSFGVGSDRAIKSAADSARTLATSLSAAAEADSRFSEAETTAATRANLAAEAIYRQAEATQNLSNVNALARAERAGVAGSGVVVTQNTGLKRVAEEAAGVKAAYLSAAESAAVFSAAGMTSTEVLANSFKPAVEGAQQTIDRMTGVSREVNASSAYWKELELAGIAAGRSVDVGMGAASRSTAIFSREARHAVGVIDSLARGQRGGAMSSIGAAMRDAGMGTAALATSMGGLVAIMGTVAVLRSAENMGHWATETKAAASAAGMSVSQYSGLAEALKNLGYTGTEADVSLRKFAANLGTAIAQPASLAAEAFHNMGITQEALAATGGNAAEGLNLLADAFAHTADGANKTANMNEIAGRGFERLVPLLQGGSAGLDAMIAKLREVGIVLDDETVAKLQATSTAVEDMGTRIRGEGIAAMEAWGPTIIDLTKLLEGLGAGASSVVNALGRLASIPISGFHVAAEALAKMQAQPGFGAGTEFGAFPIPGMENTPNIPGSSAKTPEAPAGPRVSVPPLMPVKPPVSPLTTMRRDMAQASLAASDGGQSSAQAHQAEATAEIAVMQKVLATATLTAQQRVQLETELATKQTSLANAQATAGTAAAKQNYADFAAGEKEKIALAQGSGAAILAVYDEWLAALHGKYKQSAAEILKVEQAKVQEINKIRLGELEDSVTQAKSSARMGVEQTALTASQANVTALKSPDHVFNKKDTSAAEFTSQSQTDRAKGAGFEKQAQQIASTAQQQIAKFQQIADAALQGSDTQKKAQNDVTSIVQQSMAEQTALYDKAAESYRRAGEAAAAAAAKTAASFTSFFSSLGSSFDSFQSSMIKALIAPQQELIKQGLTTIKKNQGGAELQRAVQTMLLDGVNSAAKSVEKALTTMLADSLSKTAGGSLSTALGQMFSKAVSGIGGNVAGNAAASVGGAGASAGVSGIAQAMAPVTAAVTAGTAATTAGALANTSTQLAGDVANTGLTVGAITTQGTVSDMLLVALNAKPSLLGFTYSMGGIVPSAAGGMVVGGGSSGGIPSILHPKEMVLPSHLSKGIQNIIDTGGNVGGGRGGGGGNSASLNYSPTVNMNSRGRGGTGMTRGEFSQMMSQHSGSMMGEARNLMRGGMRA